MNGEETQVIPVRGQAGVPNDATAVILNVTAANGHGFGFFTIWPTGVSAPNVVERELRRRSDGAEHGDGQARHDGSISVKDSVNRADLLIDVFGYVR